MLVNQLPADAPPTTEVARKSIATLRRAALSEEASMSSDTPLVPEVVNSVPQESWCFNTTGSRYPSARLGCCWDAAGIISPSCGRVILVQLHSSTLQPAYSASSAFSPACFCIGDALRYTEWSEQPNRTWVVS